MNSIEEISKKTFINKLLFRRSAFTLAEILVVVAIIGIIASITIPPLVNNTKDAEYKAQWKKVYSDVSQATQRVMTDNGGDFVGLCGVGNGWQDLDNCLAKQYMKYLSYTKFCAADGSEYNTCWPSVNDKYLSGITETAKNNVGAGIQLNNGAIVEIIWYPVGGTHQQWGVNCYTDGPYNVCGYLTVDTNGLKGPNQEGKDVFWIHLLDKGIKPFGSQGDDVDVAKLSGHWGCDLSVDSIARGYTCAAALLK